MKSIFRFIRSLFPPFVIIFRLNRVWIPIPFFLLWPLLILIALIAQIIMPFIKIKGISRKNSAVWPWLAYRALCMGWGTTIQVNEEDSKVLIGIY